MSERNGFRFGNLDDWHTDRELVENGAAFDAGRGRILKVRRAGGQNRKLMANLAGVSPEDTAAFHQAYARLVVTGWSGIVDADGVEVPFSVEACVALFDYAPELFFNLLLFSNDRANYRAKELADEQQAVKTPSGGSEAQALTSVN